MSDAILQALGRIEEKVDALTASGATITERVGNLKDAVDKHLAADDKVHGEQNGRITKLEHWKTAWVAKAGSWAAGIAVAVSVFVGIVVAAVKDAFAGN